MIQSRRRFLSMMTAAAAGGLSWRAATAAAGQGGWRTVKRTTRALGTNVAITAMHPDAGAAERAIGAAFAELELVESLMSIYRPRSQLSCLNRAGMLHDPHPHLLAVLRHAAETSQQTDGAFDVTVQPLWTAYADAHKRGELPSDAALAAARQKVDYRRVQIENGCVRLTGEGTAVTLNGIAQGFAADRVMQILCDHGIAHALIDTGEVGALGSRTDGEPWTIGIQHPRRHDAYVSLAKLAGRHLATSGDYATTFSSGYRHHHLFDPRTGESARHFVSVSIAAPTGMQADALSTAVFVLGPDGGRELIERTTGADAMLVLRDGSMYATAGFPLATL